jgi:uncharacterized membrane protein
VAELEAEAAAGAGRELDRIAAFTDGVIAIAITLLVLSIDVPHLPGGEEEQLADRLLDLWPNLVAYGLSFAVIGRYWIVHHRFFATLARYDGRLVALNLLFLAFLVLIPFVSELVGDFRQETPAAIAYAVALAAVGICTWGSIRHSTRAGLVRPDRREETERFGSAPALALPAVFVVSIPVAFFSPTAAELLWLATFLVHPSRRWFPHGSSA